MEKCIDLSMILSRAPYERYSFTNASCVISSASSQFFIMHKDAPHLDGQYAAFGKVTSGMDVVDSIVSAYYVGMRGTIEKVDVEE